MSALTDFFPSVMSDLDTDRFFGDFASPPLSDSAPSSPPPLSDAVSCSSGASASLHVPPYMGGDGSASSSSSSPTLEAVSSPAGAGKAEILNELLKEQNMKKQRLARKAELARISRKRKKMKLSDLEEQNSQIRNELEREAKLRRTAQTELARLQAQLSERGVVVTPVGAPQTVEQALVGESKELHGRLRAHMATGASQQQPEELNRLLNEAVVLFNKRNIQATSALASLKQQLEPSLALRFLEWAMTQNDKFYQDQNGLFNTLFHKEIGLSPEQLTRVLALREELKTQRHKASAVEGAFSSLRQELEGHLAQSAQNMQRLISLCTPEQLAKFFCWVDTFGPVCVKINV